MDCMRKTWLRVVVAVVGVVLSGCAEMGGPAASDLLRPPVICAGQCGCEHAM
jgi:hypothetical protein